MRDIKLREKKNSNNQNLMPHIYRIKWQDKKIARYLSIRICSLIVSLNQVQILGMY